MNLTNDAGECDSEKNSSTDDEEDDDDEKNNAFETPPTILIENFFSENNDHHNHDEELDSSDDDDGNDSDIENHSYSKSQLPIPNRLSSILRQSNRLVELKLNVFHPRSVSHQLRHALSDSDMSKRSHHYQNNQQEQDQQRSILLGSLSSNNFYFATHRAHRLYLPSSYLYDLQTQITNWLQASVHLTDSISASAYHRRCWSQLLLTYFIERGCCNLEFIRCTNSLSITTVDQDSCAIHKHGCVPEEDAYKLCSILQKGSRLNINSVTFEHIRHIIVIKSMQAVSDDHTNIQQIYVKQLKSLKQSLLHQQASMMSINDNSPMIGVASIYSKLLLFLSSLYSIKAETMQILFCQHLLHNPTYSYLVTS